MDVARSETLKEEVLDRYRRYLEAFLADDMDAIDNLVSYPLAYIGDGHVTMLDAWPIKPSDLMKQKDWHTTVGIEYEAVGVSEHKAHVVLRSGTRVREDGSAIEDVYGFYAWRKAPDGWKMFAVSDVVMPA